MSAFAARMARVNGSVMRALSDSTLTIAGHDLPGLFEAEYERLDVGGIGMASRQPAITVDSVALEAALAGSDAVGMPVRVSRGPGLDGHVGMYQVAESHPDGAGMTLLLLQATGGEP